MHWRPQDHDTEWPYDFFATTFRLRRKSTALLIIDMQAGNLHKDPNSAFGCKYPRIIDYWNNRIREHVLPNMKRLIELFRKKKLRIVYTRNGKMTLEGDELSGRLKGWKKGGAKNIKSFRGKPAYEIARQIFPASEDLVIDKLTSGAFTASCLDHALRNMGITDIVITGILTDMCVFGTARMASELGYNSVICEDACCTLTQRAHDEALLMHARRFGVVLTAHDIVGQLSS